MCAVRTIRMYGEPHTCNYKATIGYHKFKAAPILARKERFTYGNGMINDGLGVLQRILFAADVKPAGPSKVSLCSHAESLFGRVQRLQLAIRSPITVQLSLTLWRCTTCCEIPEQDLLEPRVEIDGNCGLWSGWRTVELRLETSVGFG